VTDALGNDITAETPTNGTFDSKAEGGNRIALRGVEFEITVTLQEGDDPNAAVAGREFSCRRARLADHRPWCRQPVQRADHQRCGDRPDGLPQHLPHSGAVIKFTGPTLTSSTPSR
jgi:flagellar hook-associated protein 3 FlgL